MRGSHYAIPYIILLYGIIPAHAGLTMIGEEPARKKGEHPRACGAHMPKKTAWQTRKGSSPRMRGSHRSNLVQRNNNGIIPAHAGLTLTNWRPTCQERDHPRACGAHRKPRNGRHSMPGSSPRMRGSPHSPGLTRMSLGIIPAHAGLTLKNPNNDAILSVSNPIFYSVLRVIL